jgi:sec-independent protein translocase protein TatA
MLALIDSEWGIIIVVIAAVILFGSAKLPKFARSLGSAQSEFKKGLAEGAKNEEGKTSDKAETSTAEPARSDDGTSATKDRSATTE